MHLSEAAAQRGLAAVPLLARVSAADLRALADLGVPRTFPGGSTLFSEGEPGDSLHTVLEGQIRVLVVSPQGQEMTLATLGAADSIGELALLDGRPRSASALAVVDTRTLALSRTDFLSWLGERPRAAMHILETLSLRLRRTNELASDLTFLDVSQRVAKQLLQRLAVPLADGDRLRGPYWLQVTQTELASAVGATREAVNKRLRELERHGWIELHRGAIEVIDRPALEGLL